MLKGFIRGFQDDKLSVKITATLRICRWEELQVDKRMSELTKKELLEWQVLTKKLEQIESRRKKLYSSEAEWAIRDRSDPSRMMAQEYFKEEHSELSDKEYKIESRLRKLDKRIEGADK